MAAGIPSIANTADEWFAYKVKTPNKWHTDSRGDLLKDFDAKLGQVVKKDKDRIQIARQIPANDGVILAFFEKKRAELIPVEQTFAKMRRELHDLVRQYRQTGSTVTARDIVELNRAVREAEIEAIDIHKGHRHTERLQEIKGSDLTFNWYDRDPILSPVSALTSSVFPALEFWQPAPLSAQPENQGEEESNENNNGSNYGNNNSNYGNNNSNNGQDGGGDKPKRVYSEKQRAIIANIMKKRAYSNA